MRYAIHYTYKIQNSKTKHLRFLAYGFSFLLLSFSANAKIWRVNNTPGVQANFSQVAAAIANASVVDGDTIYIEHSTAAYNGFTLTKRLVMIGTGYFLDAVDNAEIQYTPHSANISGSISLNEGSQGSRFIGLFFSGNLVFNSVSGAGNYLIERCATSYGSNTAFYFNNATHDNITIRKCMFFGYWVGISSSGGAITNFTMENCIFNGDGSNMSLPHLSGSNNIIRNNTFSSVVTAHNAYFANNIIRAAAQSTLTNCVIKNNIFAVAQTLPETATNNHVSTSMTGIFVGSTGTNGVDAQYQLAPGSFAAGKGLTIGTVVNPDCGAYGGPDPYVIAGTPSIPSIYGLTVPVSVPSGSTSMQVTIKTRNNN